MIFIIFIMNLNKDFIYFNGLYLLIMNKLYYYNYCHYLRNISYYYCHYSYN